MIGPTVVVGSTVVIGPTVVVGSTVGIVSTVVVGLDYHRGIYKIQLQFCKLQICDD